MRPRTPYAPSAYPYNPPNPPANPQPQTYPQPPPHYAPGQFCSPYGPTSQFPPQFPPQPFPYYYNPASPYFVNPYQVAAAGYWMPPPQQQASMVPPPPPVPGHYPMPQVNYEPRPQLHQRPQIYSRGRYNETRHFQRPRRPERKINTAQNREEIAKWIEARKKNFPTKENIRRKEELKKKGLSSFPEHVQPVSKLEQKLRKKLNFIMHEIDQEERGGKYPKRRMREGKKEDRPKEQTEQARKEDSASARAGERAYNMLGFRKADGENEEAVDLHDELQRDVEEGGFAQTHQEIEAKLKKKKRRNPHRGNSGILMSKTSKEMLYTRLVDSEKRKEASILLQCFRYLTTQNLV